MEVAVIVLVVVVVVIVFVVAGVAVKLLPLHRVRKRWPTVGIRWMGARTTASGRHGTSRDTPERHGVADLSLVAAQVQRCDETELERKQGHSWHLSPSRRIGQQWASVGWWRARQHWADMGRAGTPQGVRESQIYRLWPPKFGNVTKQSWKESKATVGTYRPLAELIGKLEEIVSRLLESARCQRVW